MEHDEDGPLTKDDIFKARWPWPLSFTMLLEPAPRPRRCDVPDLGRVNAALRDAFA